MMSRTLKRFSRNQGIVMRRWFAALFLVGLASNAGAGEFDLPTLRGSSPFVPQAPKYTGWSGFYAGGQAGYGMSQVNYSGATTSLISFMLRELALENEVQPSTWEVLGKASKSGTSFGGFVGFNTQWEDAVIGFDLNYSRGELFSSAPADPLRRVTSAGGNTYDLTIDGSASMRITDYGSARVRGGWVVGNFMPYATLGFALGRADITRTASASGTEFSGNNVTPFSFTASESKKGVFIYGWSVGGGVDMLLMKNAFLRAEFEYISFTKAQGIEAQISTVRVGAGLKF